MSKYVVFDTSAIVAAYNGEPGGESVEQYRLHSYFSSVNLAEALTVFSRANVPINTAKNLIRMLVSEIVIFDEEQATLSAALFENTKKYGLSLGDRACLALATFKKVPVLTTDRVWEKVKGDFKVVVLR